jgi:hypothetical protein
MAANSQLSDKFAPVGVESAIRAADSTPSGADVTLTEACRWLWIGGAGTVKVDTIGGSTVTYTVTAESVGVLPVRAVKIYDTGTTATGIIANW